jgi:hypothetical protein
MERQKRNGIRVDERDGENERVSSKRENTTAWKTEMGDGPIAFRLQSIWTNGYTWNKSSQETWVNAMEWWMERDMVKQG